MREKCLDKTCSMHNTAYVSHCFAHNKVKTCSRAQAAKQRFSVEPCHPRYHEKLQKAFTTHKFCSLCGERLELRKPSSRRRVYTTEQIKIALGYSVKTSMADISESSFSRVEKVERNQWVFVSTPVK